MNALKRGVIGSGKKPASTRRDCLLTEVGLRGARRPPYTYGLASQQCAWQGGASVAAIVISFRHSQLRTAKAFSGENMDLQAEINSAAVSDFDMEASIA